MHDAWPTPKKGSTSHGFDFPPSVVKRSEEGRASGVQGKEAREETDTAEGEEAQEEDPSKTRR